MHKSPARFGTGSVYTAPVAKAYFNVGNGVFFNNVFLSGMGYWETGGFTSGNTRLASNGEVLAGTVTLLNDSMISTRGATAAGVRINGQMTGGFSPYFSGGQCIRHHAGDNAADELRQ